MGAWRERFFLPLSQSRWSWLLARFHPQLTPSDGGPAMLLDEGYTKQGNKPVRGKGLNHLATGVPVLVISCSALLHACFVPCVVALLL